MTPRTLDLPFLLIASIVLLAAAAWFVLPALRMANVTLVAHGDPQRASVQGLVQTPEGEPLAGAKVTWFAASDPGGSFTMGFRGDLTTRTAADGTFRFDAVPAVEGFAVLDDAQSGFEGCSRHVLAQNGMRAEGLRLTVEAIEPTRWLRGQLRRPDGSPLPFANMQIRANRLLGPWQGKITKTDADGRFAILGPWAGAQVEVLLLQFRGEPRPLGTHTLGIEVALVVGDR